jgi:class 3 adenylate cyclase
MKHSGKFSTIERDQFTAFGPPVNLASRLEARTEGNQIIISENTKNKIEYKNYIQTKNYND